MQQTHLNKLLDRAEEEMRIRDLKSMYAYILKRHGRVVEVDEVAYNVYRVTIQIVEFDSISLCSDGGMHPSYKYHYKIVELRPSKKHV